MIFRRSDIYSNAKHLNFTPADNMTKDGNNTYLISCFQQVVVRKIYVVAKSIGEVTICHFRMPCVWKRTSRFRTIERNCYANACTRCCSPCAQKTKGELKHCFGQIQYPNKSCTNLFEQIVQIVGITFNPEAQEG